jgi:hypothetical protein
MKIVKVRITLLEEMLGMSARPDVHAKFIASKAPDAMSMEEEVEALGTEEVVENSRTVFPREKGTPFVWDYQIKGFFKDACKMLRRTEGMLSTNLVAHKQIIDGHVFPKPRKILLNLPEGTGIGNCQRPIRVETAQGPRVALADSETVPAGTTFDMDIYLMEPKAKKGKPTLEQCVEEWLDYGMLRGLHQWRNSGKGTFKYELLDVTDSGEKFA